MQDATGMLDVVKEYEGKKLIVKAIGRVDPETVGFFDEQVSDIPETINELVIDMEELEYVSSLGLSVLQTLTKAMRDRGGSCVFVRVPELVTGTFDVTGLLDFFTIE